MKKTACILMAFLLLLTACGKTETKEKDENQADKAETSLNETVEEVEVSSEDNESTKEEKQSDSAQASVVNEDKSEVTQSKSTVPKKDKQNTQTSTSKPSSGNSTTQNPSSGNGTTQKPSSGNSTTQKPSNGSNNQTTQKEETKPDTPISKEEQLKAEADAAASKYMSYYQEVLRLVNEIRAEVGVAPLTLNTELCKAASMRAIEMDYNGKLSHTRPDGSSCFTALDFYGIKYVSAGENIAMGYSTPAAVVNGWKNSEGHYKNMISTNYTQMGVGYSNMKSPYWAQLFIR